MSTATVSDLPVQGDTAPFDFPIDAPDTMPTEAPPGALIHGAEEERAAAGASAVDATADCEAVEASAPSVEGAEDDAGGSYADRVTMVPVDRFVPNGWNPNRMTDEEYLELRVEVRRNQSVAKPVVARPLPDGRLEVIDGAHNLRAAADEGLAVVPCIVEDLDDFSAMKETYKRNRSGSHDPLAEAEMFERMKKARGISTRRLAKEMNVPEATIRNRLLYVKALTARKAYARDVVRNVAHPTECDECQTEEDDRAKIGAMSQEQIRSYLDLPRAFRDRWLDDGASLKKLTMICLIGDDQSTAKQLLKDVDIAELIDLVDPGNLMMASLEYLGAIALWCWDNARVANVTAYARPVAELKLSAKVLDCLPRRMAGDGKPEAMVTVEQWTEVLRAAKERSRESAYQIILITDGIQAALEEAGKDPSAVLTDEQIGMLGKLKSAPDYIRSAGFLSIKERYRLYAESSYVADDLQEQAKRLAVAEFKRRRNGSTNGDDGPQHEAKGKSVIAVFRAFLEDLERQQRRSKEDALFADRDRMVNVVLKDLRGCEILDDATVDGRPARDVLAEDVRGLSPTMLALVAGYATASWNPSPAERWLEAVGGKKNGELSDSDDQTT
jgi:hypothetical protein